MENDTREDPVQCKVPVFLAGWMKKDTGRLLTSYKDRYIHVEKTELVIYENEDLKNCLERLDLENYDKCQEIKSPFKKKHRLILIRSPKSGNKVHDVKLQAQTAEEKDSWIKVLSNGISRAKNKVFDEVKIDESCNLEHVTRTRPKGNHNRRPPTRIHMREVALVSSDGTQRLDLDPVKALEPNGTHHDGPESSKEDVQVPMSLSTAIEVTEKELGTNAEAAQTEGTISSQKKIIKPPMPPVKEAKPTVPEEEPVKDGGQTKMVPKVPIPPPKEAKPSVASVEEATEKAKTEEIAEKCDDSRKSPIPASLSKPILSGSLTNLNENSQPPTPPSKEKKPSHATVVPEQVVHGTKEEIKEALPSFQCHEHESPSTKQVSEEESEETSAGINQSVNNELPVPTDPLQKSPSPLVSPRKKPENLGIQHMLDKTPEERELTASLQAATDTSVSFPQVEEALSKGEVPSLVVSLNDLVNDGLGLSPVIINVQEEKGNKAEEKSVDSGQHSDDDSEVSGSEDTLAASTAAMRGSHTGLDVLDTSDEDIQCLSRSVNLGDTQASTSKSQVSAELAPGFTPSAKERSASFGNLLSDSSVYLGLRKHAGAVAGNDPPHDDVMKLEAEIFLEMEKTSDLLSRASQSQRGADGEGVPENLLAKAVEKLKKADHVLREVKKLKLGKNSVNRKSW